MLTSNEQEDITSEVQTAVRHTAVYGLGSILIKGLGFLMLPVYTHYLRPVDYGILEILDLSISLLGMFLNMGMTAALLRYYGAAKTPEDKKRAISTGYIFAIVSGAVTFLLGLGLVAPVSRWLLGPGVSPNCLLLSFATLVLGFVSNPARAYIRALGNSRAFVLLDLVSVFALLSLNILFVVVLRLGLVGILLSSFIVAATVMLLLSAWTFRDVGFRFSRSLLRQMVGFGSPLVVSNLAIFVLNFSDRFFLQHLRSLEVVGVYAVGYKFGYMLNYLLVQPFCAMWEPHMYVVQNQPNHRDVFGHLFVLYSLLLTYAALIVGLVSKEIMRIMVDTKFAASQDVIPLVALAYVFWGIGYFVQAGMLLTGRTTLLGAISAATVVLNLALNYFFVSYFGMLGAAWATLLSFAAIAIACYVASQRVYPLPLGGTRVVAAMALAISLYLVSRWVAPESLVLSLLEKLAFMIIYPTALWKTRILSTSEKQTVLSAAGNAWNRARQMAGLPSTKAVAA